MNIHIIYGHLILAITSVASTMTILYALAPEVRSTTRIPLLCIVAVNAVLALMAYLSGSRFSDELGGRSDGEWPTQAVDDHASNAQWLLIGALALAVAVAWVSFTWLAPGDPTRSAWGAVVLILCAIGSLIALYYTVDDALRSVWTNHQSWR